MKRKKMPTNWVSLFTRAAARVDGKVTWVDESGKAGRIEFPNGRSTFFHNNVTSLNSGASIRIAQDKKYTRNFLLTKGYCVPEEHLILGDHFPKSLTAGRSVSSAAAFAQRVGFPVFVKPIHLGQGRGVSKVMNESELADALEFALSIDNAVLVQRYYRGHDVRLVVLDTEVICAYQRFPLSVIGDGHSSIGELLSLLQEEFGDSGRDTVINIDDQRIQRRLFHEGVTLNTVIPDGVPLRLHDIANLSAGGVAIDCGAYLAEEFKSLAIRIARDMELRFCGVDLIVSNLLDSEQSYVILEVNSAPGLDYYLYHLEAGEDHTIGLYAKVLAAVRGPK